MNNTVAVINLANTVLGIVGPAALEEIMKVKSLLELSPDIKVNITNLSDAAMTSDEDLIARVNAWRASLNPPLPPL